MPAVYAGADAPDLPAELLDSPFKLIMTLLHQIRGERWRGDGYDPTLPLPQPVADLLNELRSFEWLALPEPACQALHGLDKRALTMVCVQSIELLHGLATPQREHRRARIGTSRQPIRPCSKRLT